MGKVKQRMTRYELVLYNRLMYKQFSVHKSTRNVSSPCLPVTPTKTIADNTYAPYSVIAQRTPMRYRKRPIAKIKYRNLLSL